jgi:hypothetical protein
MHFMAYGVILKHLEIDKTSGSFSLVDDVVVLIIEHYVPKNER